MSLCHCLNNHLHRISFLLHTHRFCMSIQCRLLPPTSHRLCQKQSTTLNINWDLVPLVLKLRYMRLNLALVFEIMLAKLNNLSQI